jgi:predicted enzyme related to lactoylglutathione lyase
MKFASTRLIARDIKAMVAFYERVMGQTADWLAPQFAEIITPAATLAIGSIETVAIFQPGSCEPAANRTAIIELMVDDVDALFERIKTSVTIVHEPKMTPWGNRAAMIRDPEGTIVALFKPVSDAAVARFSTKNNNHKIIIKWKIKYNSLSYRNIATHLLNNSSFSTITRVNIFLALVIF